MATRRSTSNADILTQRQLNRSILARQHLLERVTRPALEEVEHLVGLQAQVPIHPCIGLWSRLEGFTTDELSGLVERSEAIRTPVMGGTLHLVTAADARRFGRSPSRSSSGCSGKGARSPGTSRVSTSRRCWPPARRSSTNDLGRPRRSQSTWEPGGPIATRPLLPMRCGS